MVENGAKIGWKARVQFRRIQNSYTRNGKGRCKGKKRIACKDVFWVAVNV